MQYTQNHTMCIPEKVVTKGVWVQLVTATGNQLKFNGCLLCWIMVLHDSDCRCGQQYVGVTVPEKDDLFQVKCVQMV